MKASPKLHRLICLFICFAMVLQPMTFLSVFAAESDNLLTNGTFSDSNADGKADGWTYWNSSGTTAASTSIGSDGLTITADSSASTQRLSVNQTVKNLDAAKTYRFTGTYNVTSKSNGALEIGYYANATGSRVNAVKIQTTTNGVQTFEITFTGVTSAKLEAAVSSGATLTCTVNDFKLTEVVEEPEAAQPLNTLLLNGTSWTATAT